MTREERRGFTLIEPFDPDAALRSSASLRSTSGAPSGQVGAGGKLPAMRKGRTGGFTLIELLVVVVILGLLAVVGLPMLSRAKAVARQVACANNLRNIGVACGAHRAREKQAIPVSTWTVALTPLVSDTDVFICPETERPGAQTVDLRSLYVEEWQWGYYWGNWYLEPDLEAGEKSLWAWEMLEKDETGFTIGMSDSWNNQYDDLILRFDYLGGNQVKVTYVGRDDGGLTYHLKSPNGEMILEGMGLGGKNAKNYGMSATFGAALATYGMNSLTGPTSLGRDVVLVLDYGKTVASCAGPDALDVWEDWIAPRHLGRCNVLFGDGGVESMHPARIDPHSPGGARWIP